MNSNNRISHMESIQKEGLELFKKCRLWRCIFKLWCNWCIGEKCDKISRLQSITTKQIFINTESLRDTLIDLHNYSAMAIMLLDEKRINK